MVFEILALEQAVDEVIENFPRTAPSPETSASEPNLLDPETES